MKLSELKKALKGVDIVQTTPFNKDGSVDLGGMRANTQWLLQKTKGKDFIITPLGSTGEFYAMSDDECKAVAKTVVDEVKGKNLVFVGAGRAGTQETIKMAKYAESIGADGVQVVLPFYHVPEEDGMYNHYKALAESVKIGIMIYNNPDVSGSWIQPPLMAKLSKIPNVVALKENSGSIQAFYNMARAIDPMAIFCGLDVQQYAYASLFRCSGVVSGLANFCPEMVYSQYEAASAGDYAKMKKIADNFAPFFEYIGKIHAKHAPDTAANGRSWPMFLGVLKAAQDLVGCTGGTIRAPLYGLTNAEKEDLRGYLKTMKVVK